MKIVLASTSQTRKKLLTDAGIVFEIDGSDYEEDLTLPMPPKELAVHLSAGKAKEVAQRHSEAIVLGADTFAVYQDKILGKPHTAEKAREMLQMLNGKQHSAITGFTIVDTKNKNIISKAVETKVFFKNLTDKEIDDYVATGEPLNKAGSYAILEIGAGVIDKTEGSKSNVAGLPMEEVLEVLKELQSRL
jgi:septum formation protein